MLLQDVVLHEHLQHLKEGLLLHEFRTWNQLRHLEFGVELSHDLRELSLGHSQPVLTVALKDLLHLLADQQVLFLILQTLVQLRHLVFDVLPRPLVQFDWEAAGRVHGSLLLLLHGSTFLVLLALQQLEQLAQVPRDERVEVGRSVVLLGVLEEGADH